MEKLIGFLLALLVFIPGRAQESVAQNYVQIDPAPLAIAVGKTTNIIYPFTIKSVDRGSRDVLVQKAKGLENILLVKAGKECFEDTNLTVVTTDGKLYSYSVRYDEATSQLNLDYTKGNALNTAVTFNAAQAKALSKAVALSERNIYGIKDKSDGVKLLVEGLFVRENIFFFRVQIENKTNINYDINQLRFFIKDQKKSRRTASQENEIKQLYVHNPVSAVRGNGKEVIIITVPKFTIPDKKEMIVQVMEKDGGRHLEVHIKNRTIMKAEILP